MAQAAPYTDWDALERPSEDGPSAADVMRWGGKPRWYQWESTRAEWRREREIRTVLTMHRQGLLSRRRARLLLHRQGVDVGGWTALRERALDLLYRVAGRLRRRR